MSESLIPERIKAARESLGITKAEASRRLNLSKIGYCRYEYGDRTPSIQTLEVIARCFNTSVDYLTGETNNIEPDYIIISKADNKELFELVSTIKKREQNHEREEENASGTIERILEYYKSITKE